MRMLMQIQLPLEPFNSAIRDGSVGPKIQKILQAIKPEAAYFSEQDGKRGGVLVVNVNDPSDVPKLAEPWFLTFNAQVEFRIAMTPEDLGRAGLETLGKNW
ncbi:MAG: panthothenate synthetase [Bryobacterales bacterium]|nr:panthothenate synthetase [Bryobacterales bacterium]MBV9398602.1 panthothenate synthetase [Bryobacterales bacterium]